MRRELKSWMGHTPRDRGSIWHIAPVAENVVIIVLAFFLLAAVVFG